MDSKTLILLVLAGGGVYLATRPRTTANGNGNGGRRGRDNTGGNGTGNGGTSTVSSRELAIGGGA
jgi:hypothetical protein